jgi:hypothetical protein
MDGLTMIRSLSVDIFLEDVVPGLLASVVECISYRYLRHAPVQSDHL